MVDVYIIRDESGKELDARFTVDGRAIVLHSRGGAKGKDAVNADYTEGLILILKRLQSAGHALTGAWLDSAASRALPAEERQLLARGEESGSPEQIASLLARRMKSMRARPSVPTRGGNSTKRIRLVSTFAGTADDIAAMLQATRVVVDHRSLARLPAEVLNKVTPEFVFAAVQQLLRGDKAHGFGPSTDYDLIADEGVRLPPKAVFGKALSDALGGVSISPKHFTAGETSACFRLLREAGYLVVKKGESAPSFTGDPDADDSVDWSEGKKTLVTHLRGERKPGLAKAKKAQYLRQHGKLLCERCGLDPVAKYGTPNAEACIEVHHASVQVSQMNEGHRTALADLQCLCANCHRLVHRELRLSWPAESLQPKPNEPSST